MRIFLLRLLIASWMIPILVLTWPIAYLIFGFEEAVECLKELIKIFWFGT